MRNFKLIAGLLVSLGSFIVLWRSIPPTSSTPATVAATDSFHPIESGKGTQAETGLDSQGSSTPENLSRYQQAIDQTVAMVSNGILVIRFEPPSSFIKAPAMESSVGPT